MMMKDYKSKSMLCWLLCLFLNMSLAQAQDHFVTGTIYDENGSEIPGVSILIKGTSKGTVTNIEGKFKLKAPKDGVLVISYVGYTTQEFQIAGKSIFEINLEPDLKQLEEVVVVGYGTQTKREVTGSIAKVEGEKLLNVSVPSFEAALQGQAAGVQVIQGSGMAGSGSVIRVRGIASLSAGGDPLYIIDGMPITQDPFINGSRGAMNNNPLATINPNDIESIEILKDASAAAIYGSRGANGVVLVTTKRGTKGKPTFDFSAKLGMSEPARRLDLLNSSEWLQLYQEAWENDGNTGRAPLRGGISWEDALNTDTDWQDLVTRTGIKQDYNLSMRQGNDKLSTYIGLSYSDNESFLEGNNYERISSRLNLDYNILDNLKTSLTTMFSQGVNNRVFAAWAGGLGAATSDALPIYPVKNADGTFFSGGSNPVRQQELNVWRVRENRSISSLSLEYEPIKDLKVRVAGNLDYMDIQDDQFEDEEWNDFRNIARRFPTWITNYTGSATVSYNFNINESNKITVLAGSEYQYSLTGTYDKFEVGGALGALFTDPEVEDIFDQDDNPIENLAFERGPNEEWSFISYFGRLNWNHKDKIILNGSLRVDGSSRFGRNYRYGFFPSAGVGYIISEEDFFPELGIVNSLKLKASWGITGNADIGNYERFGTFRRLPGDIGNRYNQRDILFPIRLNNDDLRWETQRTIDFGFELGLLENRITAEFAYFDKLSSDVLIDRLVQASTGFERYLENIGSISNRGLEFGFKSRNIVGDFSWTTDFNISRLYNEVIDIGATPPDAIAGSGDTRVVEGLPVGVNFLNRFSYVDPDNGLPVFLDKEGNETYEFNLEDRVPVGSVVPDATGGITNTFSYKNIDLSFLFTFTIGGNIYDDAAKRQLGIVSDWNMRRDIVDRWRQPGDIAKFPRLTQDPTTYGGLPSFWNLNTTQFLYDASFLRLRSLTLGYNIPSKSKIIKNARVYATGTNLLTFTKYPGPDPEIVRDHDGPQGRNLSPNVTYLTPPQERAISLGVNLRF